MTTLQEFALSLAEAILPVLPTLLKAYWILASASVLLTLLPLPIPRAFKAAVRLAASRGKLWHTRPDAKALGPLQDLSVPQQLFEHFYLVGALVNTVALQVYIFVCCEEADPNSTLKRDSLLALLLFEIHVLRRYAETTYVLFYPESARMHVLAYLFGLSYYVAVPLTLLPESVLNMDTLRDAWQLAVGEGPAHWKSVDARLYSAVASPHPGWTRLAAGVALYLAASILQFASHMTLGRMSRASDARLKEEALKAALFAGRQAAAAGGKGQQKGQAAAARKAAQKEGEEERKEGSAAEGAEGAPPPGAAALSEVYRVPRGGAFELVSCPHYLAEVLLYVALAVVTRGSPGSLLIAAWVLLNLALAAGATQRWYRTQFPDYPRKRAALLPWIY